VSTEVPLPPIELLQRVGRIEEPDLAGTYVATGRRLRTRLERLLPDDWSWEGKRVLDFGCGAGRTLRHFLDEAERGEFYGCDIDGPSIAWLSKHLSPPLHAFQSGETPKLPQPDGFFDLVYAFSVFTHLTDHWAGWLLELHRVLKPNGLLLATFLSEPHWKAYGQGEWDEDRVGMNVLTTWKPWEEGGPSVFHSEWWIREHWGRAFEVMVLERNDPDDPQGQGVTLLRRRPERLQPADLEQPANDSRELASLRRNIEQLHHEAGGLYAELSQVVTWHEELTGEHELLAARLQRVQDEFTRLSHSRRWHSITARAAVAAVRRMRNR
jgi:SAM-dependent methyltransferase